MVLAGVDGVFTPGLVLEGIIVKETYEGGAAIIETSFIKHQLHTASPRKHITWQWVERMVT